MVARWCATPSRRIGHFSFRFATFGCGPGGAGASSDTSIFGSEDTGGDTGETGVVDDECYLADDFTQGVTFACQGQGNGRFRAEFNNWPAEEACADPDGDYSQQCASFPLTFPASNDQDGYDLSDLNVPDPAVCCTTAASAAAIEDACELDCGFSAAFAGVQALLDAAEEANQLPPFTDPAVDDLNEFSQFVNNNAASIAKEVRKASPNDYELNLMEGSSNTEADLHIKQATLWLNCDLDDVQPYDPTPGATCTESANSLPDTTGGSSSSGTSAGGDITIAGPLGAGTVDVFGGSYTYTIGTTCRPTGCPFTLSTFDMDVAHMWLGNVHFEDITVSLSSRASGSEDAGSVTFAGGSIDASITTIATQDGVVLNGGAPVSFSLTNTGSADATVFADGSFQFDSVSFDIDPSTFGYTDTEFWDGVVDAGYDPADYGYDPAAPSTPVQTLTLTTDAATF